jgi:hypothetical protein
MQYAGSHARFPLGHRILASLFSSCTISFCVLSLERSFRSSLRLVDAIDVLLPFDLNLDSLDRFEYVQDHVQNLP